MGVAFGKIDRLMDMARSNPLEKRERKTYTDFHHPLRRLAAAVVASHPN
jgi:hypothetical protein